MSPKGGKTKSKKQKGGEDEEDLEEEKARLLKEALAEEAKKKADMSDPLLEKSDEAMRATRCRLPIFQYREQILETVRKNPICVILGETGSGKTTQVMKLLS